MSITIDDSTEVKIKKFLQCWDKTCEQYAHLNIHDFQSFMESAVHLLREISGHKIHCFSNVKGHKEAIDLVTDLNAMKTSKSSEFYIEYDKHQDYNKDDTYKVVGEVCEDDWYELNMMDDFMRLDDE